VSQSRSQPSWSQIALVARTRSGKNEIPILEHMSAAWVGRSSLRWSQIRVGCSMSWLQSEIGRSSELVAARIQYADRVSLLSSSIYLCLYMYGRVRVRVNNMARMTIWSGFIEDRITAMQCASQWLDEINESTKWQDGIFYTLCAAYGLVLRRFSNIMPFLFLWPWYKLFTLNYEFQNMVGQHKRVYISWTLWSTEYGLLSLDFTNRCLFSSQGFLQLYY